MEIGGSFRRIAVVNPALSYVKYAAFAISEPAAVN
jgi:hypothetical protein